ncbi:hypothetical protein ACYPKM_02610 [Pseudomonas aeruginosa]
MTFPELKAYLKATLPATIELLTFDQAGGEWAEISLPTAEACSENLEKAKEQAYALGKEGSKYSALCDSISSSCSYTSATLGVGSHSPTDDEERRSVIKVHRGRAGQAVTHLNKILAQVENTK